MSTQQQSVQTAHPPSPRHGVWQQLRFLKPFWTAPDQKVKARLMLGGIIGLTLAEIAITGGIAFGFQAALNALVAKNALGFALSGGATVAALATNAVAGGTRDYMALHLGQNWRGWLTRQFNDAWLNGKTYLRLQHSKSYAQNPDHRIAETIPNVTTQTVQLGLALFRSIVGFATFSVLLWNISPLMVGAAFLCAATAHFATHRVGGSIGKVWKSIMDADAKFRHALVRLRDNAKPIALAGLEAVENEVLRSEFDSMDTKRREFYKVNFRTSLVGSFNMTSATVVPIALMAPKFFAGAATLGSLELTRQVYGQFYNALSWFPSGYAAIASWSANVSQLMSFRQELEENKADVGGKQSPETQIPPPPSKEPVEPKR